MALYARPNRPELDATKVPSALDIAWAACLEFLTGKSPVDMSLEELTKSLQSFYKKSAATTEKNPDVRRQRQATRHRQHMDDPDYRERIRQRSERQRKNMTPEQRENFRKYQQEYYQQKKANSKLHVIAKAS